MANGADMREMILQQIRGALQNAEARARALRRRNSLMVSTGLVAGGLGTILAGLAAARGPLAGQGSGAWKLTCGVVGVLSACATLFPGLNQQLSVPDRLVKVTACVGRLRALEIALTVTQRDPAVVATEYQEVASTYQECMF